MTQVTEIELVEASRRGERAAFGQLVERFAQMVSAVSFAATRDRALSEDITQETFVAAWTELHRLRDAKALRPWLCRIARNLAHKARRVRAHETALADPDAVTTGLTPFDQVRNAQVEHVVAAALERVPEPYREALVLFYYEQQSAKDVAAALGVTEDVVHKRVSRGRTHLAAGLAQLVADHLEQRRPRRHLAACVIALLPSHVTKGFRMSKIMFATATIAVVVGVNAEHVQGSPSTKEPRSAAIARRPAAARIAPAITIKGLTCTDAAERIVSIAGEGHEDEFQEHADRVARTTTQLEDDCHVGVWTAGEIECVVAADDMQHVRACTAGHKRPLPYVAPVTDLSCSVLGTHVGQLMIADMRGMEQDNVLVSVIQDPDELLQGVKDQCVEADWPEALRRCYAAATRFRFIVECNLQDE